MKLYESISENLMEESHENYHYIDGADYDKYGYDGIYNTEANTDVVSILEELERYFNESSAYVKDALSKATHDIGFGFDDPQMLKQCASKVKEIRDTLEKSWE